MFKEKIKFFNEIIEQNKKYSTIPYKTKNQLFYNNFGLSNIKQHKDLMFATILRLNNVSFDEQQNKKYKTKQLKYIVVYEKDENTYKFLNKQISYKDFSLRQILKILKNTHVINTFDYKKAIRTNKLSNKLKGHIAFYMKQNNKPKKDKSNMITKKPKRKGLLVTAYNGLNYNVVLKKRQYEKINKLKNLKKFIIYDDLIQKEFNTKLQITNKIISKIKIS